MRKNNTPTNFTADKGNDALRIVHNSKGKLNVAGLQLERIKSAFHIPPTTEAAPPLSPMFYGITIDTLVTLTALTVIWGMGLM